MKMRTLEPQTLEKSSKKPSYLLSHPQLDLSPNLLLWVSIVSPPVSVSWSSGKAHAEFLWGYHPSAKILHKSSVRVRVLQMPWLS